MRKESEVLNAICEYLQAKRYFFYRSNNIPVYDTSRKCFRSFPKWCVKGVPDLFVLTVDKTIGLEVKRDKAYQSPEQKLFQEFWSSVNARREYYVVRSVEDVMKVGL